MSSRQNPRVDCFSVFAAADPSTLPRILEVFSLFGLIPCVCHSTRVEADDQLVVDIQIEGLAQGHAEQLARRLGRGVTVTQVLWSQKHRVATPRAA